MAQNPLAGMGGMGPPPQQGGGGGGGGGGAAAYNPVSGGYGSGAAGPGGSHAPAGGGGGGAGYGRGPPPPAGQHGGGWAGGGGGGGYGQPPPAHGGGGYGGPAGGPAGGGRFGGPRGPPPPGHHGHHGHHGHPGGAGAAGGPPSGGASSRGVSSDLPQSIPPTPVLHIRQLPFGATPHDIAEFMSQFGPVDFASHLPNRGQALVEFRDTASAVRAIETGQQRPLVLGDRTLFVNFSRSKQINRAVAVSMAPSGDQAAANGQVGAAFDASGGTAPLAPRPDVMDDRPLPAPAAFVSPVLCLHVNKATAPIDVDTVLRVCEAAELRPLRVVIFYKHGVQALVEMDSPATALALAERVHNQFIYEDCCKIVAAPSRSTSNLNVTVQNDLTRDLTRSDLPSGPPSNPRTLSPAQMADRERAIEAGAPPPPMPWEAPAGAGGAAGHPGGAAGAGRPLPPHAAAGPPGGVGGGGYRGPMGPEAGGPPRGPPPAAGFHHMHGGPPGTAPPPHHAAGPAYGAPPPPPPGPPAPRGGHSGASATSAYVPGSGGRGSIVLVLGLDPARATARRVFNVVCSYGNVRRILCRPPGADPADGGAASALVEFEDPTQAGGAASFLDGHVLFDRKLSLTVAEADRIDGDPLPGEESDPLGAPHVRDWVGSPHNRFRRVEQFRNVFKPSSTLHVSNIPPTYQQDHLEAVIIGQGGARPSRVAWMDPPGGRFTVGAPRRVALVQFATVSEALESMMMANNVFQDGHTIKFAPTNKTPR